MWKGSKFPLFGGLEVDIVSLFLSLFLFLLIYLMSKVLVLLLFSFCDYRTWCDVHTYSKWWQDYSQWKTKTLPGRQQSPTSLNYQLTLILEREMLPYSNLTTPPFALRTVVY